MLFVTCLSQGFPVAHRLSCTSALQIIFAALSLLSSSGHAQMIQTGEYLTEGGGSTLTITRNKNALAFSIEAVGANGHTCTLDGDLRDGRATLEGLDAGKPCVVTFAAGVKGIEVNSGENGACRMYCGARAGFDGLYLKPAPQCFGRAVKKSRDQFKRQYDAKNFSEARRTLEDLLSACGKTLDWLESGRMRNDLAVTLHKLGDFAACNKVLAPLAEDARKNDEGIRDAYPPSDAENYLPIVRATRTNLKLCGGKK